MRSVPSSAAVEHGDDLRRCLADVAGDEPGPVGLDQVALLHDAEGPVDARQQPGDGRLPGAGVAGEHEVAALVEHRAGRAAGAAAATRVRSTTRWISRFTDVIPTSASSSARRSSSGSGGSVGGGRRRGRLRGRRRRGGGRRRRAGHALEQVTAERLDRRQLVGRGVDVGGDDAEGDLERGVVVRAGMAGAVASVDVDEELEHLRGTGRCRRRVARRCPSGGRRPAPPRRARCRGAARRRRSAPRARRRSGGRRRPRTRRRGRRPRR